MKDKIQLIDSIEFETALNEGAECKKTLATTYKSQNKTNFDSFYEVMLEANDEVQEILSKKRSKRTEDEIEKVIEFKNVVRSMYNQAQMLTVDEHLDEGKKTKIEKIVDKIVPVIDILAYIGFNELEKAFNKHGIKLVVDKKLEDKYPSLNDDAKRAAVKGILTSATSIKQKVVDDNIYINEDIFLQKVPADLQYDKNCNNIGLKTSDWRKLVDAKAKLIMASTEEAKEKAEEKIEDIAEQKQFEAARAELVRDKLTKLQ